MSHLFICMTHARFLAAKLLNDPAVDYVQYNRYSCGVEDVTAMVAGMRIKIEFWPDGTALVIHVNMERFDTHGAGLARLLSIKKDLSK